MKLVTSLSTVEQVLNFCLRLPGRVLFSSLLVLLLPAPAWAEESQETRYYDTHFEARFDPATDSAAISITIRQPESLIRLVDLAAPAKRYSDFSGDGEIEHRQGRLLWIVPADGGTLQFQAKVNHRKGDAHDARMTEEWAVLRLDDLFPAARVRALIGAASRSSFSLHGPDGWRFESRYGPVKGRLEISNEGRKFDRPTGWLAAGELGVRREVIRGRRVALAGPTDQGMRRLDTLAFLRWTLPRLLKVFSNFPDRLLIVGARDDMWRGGLSGPASLYLHNERPLISGNGTSAPLHELVHVATGSATQRDDWLIEGLAEYYSLEILRRSGGISQKRYDVAMRTLADWVKRKNGRLQSPSSGANTARAVLLLWNLQQDLQQRETASLDDLVQEMVNAGEITGQALLELTENAIGGRSTLLRKALAEVDAP
jgi:hypothetical protein